MILSPSRFSIRIFPSLFAVAIFLVSLVSLPAASIINSAYDRQFDSLVTKSAAGFTHPGILHSREDLNRMRDAVWAGRQPWARGFEALRKVPQAAKDYAIQGPFKDVGYENGQYEFRRDASAAYDETLMWYLTGDADYSKKAIAILNAWSYGMETFDKGDHITGGMGVQKFAAAAEILRSTPSAGWPEKDIAQFKIFLERMRPAVDKPDLFMNQGGYGMIGMLSIAVFLDDAELYKKTILRATVGDGKDPQKDPAISKTIWPSGQVVEMGRDQTHPQGGLGTLACIAQTATIQGLALTGVDLFDYLDQRLRKGYEYLAAHELGYDVEYLPQDEKGTPGYYKKFQDADRGRLAPIFEIAYNHYRCLKKVPPEALRYTGEMRHLLDPEPGNEDFPGFGTLTYSQMEAAEDVPPVGPPQALPEKSPALGQTGRHAAADFDATQGVGREYYTDPFGSTHLTASNIQANDWVRFDHFDFGDAPVDAIMASAGSASVVGCKIDIFLDSLESEPVGTLQVENTGWWSTYSTFMASLKRPVSGKHSVFLRFYGGKHVYKFECNLDWFEFGQADALAAEMKKAAMLPRFPLIPGTAYAAVVSGQAKKNSGDPASAEILENGTTISFNQVEFSSGASVLELRVAGGSGKIEMRTNDRQKEPFAVVEIPASATPEAWQTIRCDLSKMERPIKGGNMVFLTFTGGAFPMQLASLQLDPPVSR